VIRENVFTRSFVGQGKGEGTRPYPAVKVLENRLARWMLVSGTKAPWTAGRPMCNPVCHSHLELQLRRDC
jgi:hypothetical protein